MILRAMVLFLAVFGWLASGLAYAETSHSALKIDGIPVQLPYASRTAGDDRLVDVYALQGILPISVNERGEERVIRYGCHQLEVQPGRRAALLDGRWLILSHAPVAVPDGLLLPNRQLFDLLAVPYRMDGGQVNVTAASESLAALQQKVAGWNEGRAKIGFVGVLQPNRWIVAAQILAAGRPVGYGDLYEAVRETAANGAHTWKLTKLRTISDTASNVFLEWMPNGSIFENIVADKRPEFLVVETCNCAGRYQYGTMFTVTEMGLVPVWHSQAAYDRVEKTDKGWELVTYRKDAIPTRPGSTMPYWEIHEMWNGQSFVITKQEYRDPLQEPSLH
ncbi:hypothetical protein [Effusibacillus pohliae]|uniref:hypothetical protein n=1 Tax=Effusibacillus pohliae TaxID=232270 RepID=UPI00037252F0|nr:hypothetical protein [Effusibacillus pohliae]